MQHSHKNKLKGSLIGSILKIPSYLNLLTKDKWHRFLDKAEQEISLKLVKPLLFSLSLLFFIGLFYFQTSYSIGKDKIYAKQPVRVFVVYFFFIFFKKWHRETRKNAGINNHNLSS